MAASAEEIADLREIYEEYRAALKAVLRNQSYEMPDGRKLARADLDKIRVGMREAKRDLDSATGFIRPVGRMRRGVNMSR